MNWRSQIFLSVCAISLVVFMLRGVSNAQGIGPYGAPPRQNIKLDDKALREAVLDGESTPLWSFPDPIRRAL